MTIREISLKTGLSSTTICKAIKDPSSVKSTTLKKLENFLNQDKSSISIDSIYIILPNIQNNFFGSILSSIIYHLELQGLEAIVHFSYDNPQKEKQLLKKLASNYNSGIIWIPGEYTEAKDIDFDINSRIVVVDRLIDHSDFSLQVVLNNSQITKTAVNILLENNAKSPVLITGTEQSYSAQQRAQGMEEAIQINSLEPKQRVFYSDFNESQQTYQLCLSLLQNNQYDSFVLGNQFIAYAFLKALNTLGLKVSKDISCITFDVLPNKELLIQPISMISVSEEQMGNNAVQLLLESSTNTNKLIMLEGVFYLQGSEKLLSN